MNHMEMTAEEAAMLIEISTDALYRRIRWTIGHEGAWRSLEIDQVQLYIQALSNLHTKAWLLLKDLDGPHVLPDFEDAFMIPDDVWDLIDEIGKVQSWDQIQQHLHSPSLCRVCRILAHEASNQL